MSFSEKPNKLISRNRTCENSQGILSCIGSFFLSKHLKKTKLSFFSLGNGKETERKQRRKKPLSEKLDRNFQNTQCV